MKIFINDIPVNIIPPEKTRSTHEYDHIYETSELGFDISKITGDTLIKHASIDHIKSYLTHLKQNKYKKLEEVTFIVDQYDEVKKKLKAMFTIVIAAGGLVEKGDDVLLIYRLKKWDLPKGKLEKHESIKEGAIREVEEECNIKVKLEEKIGNTWHTYKRNGKNILKKTIWYRMACIDDQNMKPQEEEDIEAIQWMDQKELKQAFYNTYPSIRHVFKKYYKLQKKRENQSL
ncbi:MAG TPA: NUDIX domain-containing protein [Cytophagales bacterium]|jgi:ADP-ribose pyrophosphatase YjhB (NUDIX family)|nr:NUDIX domain-containing protein [Cytophagales bacterium]